MLHGSRSCLIEFTNRTGHVLRVQSHTHDHGGFAEPPSAEVPAETVDIFGSQSKGGSFATGTNGSVTYRLGDSNTTVRIGWNHPFVGDVECNARVDGDNRLAFHLTCIAGSGDTAHMKYDLRPVDTRGHAVFGAILEKWASMGYSNGLLKFPVMSEAAVADGVGRFQNFEGGMVYWHPQIGAFAVWGLIGERWIQIGKEKFGYPVTDETVTPDGVGRFNHFRAFTPGGPVDASIYWTRETGAHEVFGGIRHKWAEMGFEKSHLGYPVSHEVDHEGGRLQRFQGGALFWNGREVLVR
ncbi:LGFP repeat-containing protein [Micromonospora sp. H33]|uniref:LGFP repeat-containing protein n=1 Tax=Micromonospora sp. H33 TaxID=3452215 RepID=UPI003F8A4FCE